MTATASSIAKGSEISAMDQARQLGWVKVFQPNILNIEGVQCSIYKDPSGADNDAKVAGIRAGLKRVVDAGHTFPDGIKFYLTQMLGVQSIAFHRTFDGSRAASVQLGASSTDSSSPGMYAGVAHSVAPGGGKDYCAAVVVHELGHNLHERANEGFFWDGKEAMKAPDNAGSVSAYASKNRLEFVAEVFTGRIYGLTYGAEVNTEYTGYGGPA